MWFVDWMVDACRMLQQEFHATAGDIKWVPYVGEALAYPFDVVSSFFGTLGSGASSLSSWVDYADLNINNLFSNITYLWDYVFNTVATSINNAVSDVNDLWNYIYGTLTTTVNNAIALASDASASVYGWVSSAIDAVTSTANSAYNYAYGWLSDAVNAASSMADSAYHRAWDITTGLAGDIWTWITTNPLPGYLDAWFQGMRDLVIGWIVGAMEYLITVAFTTLGACWSTFEDSFSWLMTQLIDLATRRMVSFASLLWGAIEALLENIKVNR